MKKRISYSELGSLDCWQKHHYRYVEKIRPISTFGALIFGRVWDEALNAYYSDGGDLSWILSPDQIESSDLNRSDPSSCLDRALEKGMITIDEEADRIDRLMADRSIPRPETWHDDLDNNRELLLRMLLHYHKHWKPIHDEFQIIGVQVPVTASLPSLNGIRASSRYEFHGIIDRIIRNKATGEVFIVDAKTTASISAEYRLGFDIDWQLPLYCWAMRQNGYRITGAMIDAAAKIVPIYPAMRSTPIAILDESGQPIIEPIPCPACEYATHESPACIKCDGDRMARYTSGPRKGEIKTRKVTRAALHSMLSASGSINYLTTHDAMLDAIQSNDLNPDDYRIELELLESQEAGITESPFFWREWIRYSDTEILEAVESVRAAATMTRSLPPIKMPSPMKCRRCEFRKLCAARPGERDDLKAAFFTTQEQREASSASAEPQAF